ncbi:hypothetical protein F4678DRAFT_481174, partial [Xylaria arbuscula]
VLAFCVWHIGTCSDPINEFCTSAKAVELYTLCLSSNIPTRKIPFLDHLTGSYHRQLIMDSMRLHWSGILAICLLHQNVCAFTRSLPLDERWENHQQCIEMGAGDSFNNTKIDCQGRLRVAELGLCGALVIVALLFLLIVVASLWSLLKRQTPQEFASSFSQVRSWLIDSPRDYIFMLWTFCLVFYDVYKDTYQLRSSETRSTGSEEMQLFRDTAEDPSV